MALWSISEDSYNRRCIAEDVPVMKPIFRFPNILRDHNHTTGERVRSLAYNSHGYVSWYGHVIFNIQNKDHVMKKLYYNAPQDAPRWPEDGARPLIATMNCLFTKVY